MRFLALFLLAASAVSTTAFAQRAASYSGSVKAFITADQPIILIKNARLWDGTGASARDAQDMLVRDGRVAAIGARLKAPGDAKIIDAHGQTLMPGLVMMHEHLDSRAPGARTAYYSNPYIAQILLAYGTTTARTAGGLDIEGDLHTKARIASGWLAGPDLDVSVPINGPEPTETLAFIADGEAARREIAYWNGRGATSVKLFFDTTPEIAAAAVDEAHKRGMTVAAHLCATFAKTAAEAGIDTLEHSMLAVYDIVPGATEGECPGEERQSAMLKSMATLDPQGPEVGKVLDILLKYNVAIDPTIGGRDLHWCVPKTKPAPRELALLAKWEPGEGLFCFPGTNAEIEARGVAFQLATAIRYHRMGGMLVMGTDKGVVQGAMGPRELELVVAGGLTPAEALVAATRNGAIKLKREKDIGTLEVGKRADFLLIDGKPDVAISDIRMLTHVARDGIIYDPEKLYQDAKGKLP